MIISVASGKGGTGKTTVAINLALSLSHTDTGMWQFLDCDVEEPNAHIFLRPQITQRQAISIPVPKVDENKCTYCGKCQEVCEYNAIAVIKNSAKGARLPSVGQGSASGGKVLIFPELCHGCGGCSLLCPEKTITEIGKNIGLVEIGSSTTLNSNFQFINGKLNVGEAMSPPLIRAVKSKIPFRVKNIANNKVVIIDAPPGTSCPVIESIKGSNYCILVTEPTPFGLNDLVLAIEVLRKLNIPFGIVINQSDIGDKETEKYCSKKNIPVLMKIPFDRKIAEAYSNGISIVEAIPEYREKFAQLFKNIKERQEK